MLKKIRSWICDSGRRNGNWTSSKIQNPNREIEILVWKINDSQQRRIPPFTIEDETDGGEELRMKYRYLDIRRNPVKEKLIFRHKMAQKKLEIIFQIKDLLVETPVLINQPEGREISWFQVEWIKTILCASTIIHQTFKQLLMVGGMDRYFQIEMFPWRRFACRPSTRIYPNRLRNGVCRTRRCFEILKEWPRIYWKTSQERIRKIPRMTFDEAMKTYEMTNQTLDSEWNSWSKWIGKGKDFKIFDEAELVVGINVEGCADYTRKQIDELIDWVKRPQIGASGMVWIKFQNDGVVTSSVK